MHENFAYVLVDQEHINLHEEWAIYDIWSGVFEYIELTNNFINFSYPLTPAWQSY